MCWHFYGILSLHKHLHYGPFVLHSVTAPPSGWDLNKKCSSHSKAKEFKKGAHDEDPGQGFDVTGKYTGCCCCFRSGSGGQVRNKPYISVYIPNPPQLLSESLQYFCFCQHKKRRTDCTWSHRQGNSKFWIGVTPGRKILLWSASVNVPNYSVHKSNPRFTEYWHWKGPEGAVWHPRFKHSVKMRFGSE